MQGRQNAAKIRVEEIESSLGYYILKNSAVVLLMRDYAESGTVIESAKKNPSANIVLDALMIEKKMFQQVFGNQRTQVYTYNSDVVNRMNILMSEIGMKIEALSLPIIMAEAKYFGTTKSREEMILRMERVLYETYHDELKLHFFRSLIMDEIATRFDRDAVNIVIANVNPNMVRAFSSYSDNTQIMSNDGIVSKGKRSPAPAPVEKTTEPEAPAQTAPQVTGPVLNRLSVEGNTSPVVKKPYTGAKRGRKTNEERAARAAAETKKDSGLTEQ